MKRPDFKAMRRAASRVRVLHPVMWTMRLEIDTCERLNGERYWIIRASAAVPNRESREPIPFNVMTDCMLSPAGVPEEGWPALLAARAKEVLCQMACHEVDEMLLLDNERVVEAHAGEVGT